MCREKKGAGTPNGRSTLPSEGSNAHPYDDPHHLDWSKSSASGSMKPSGIGGPPSHLPERVQLTVLSAPSEDGARTYVSVDSAPSMSVLVRADQSEGDFICTLSWGGLTEPQLGLILHALGVPGPDIERAVRLAIAGGSRTLGEALDVHVLSPSTLPAVRLSMLPSMPPRRER